MLLLFRFIIIKPGTLNEMKFYVRDVYAIRTATTRLARLVAVVQSGKSLHAQSRATLFADTRRVKSLNDFDP